MQYFGFDRPSFGIKTFGFGANFDPMTLFAGGKKGVWYDPSDKSTLFQDVAGTIPVTKDGDPIGLMKDKSGNGNHATQPVSTARPTYRADGVLHWLDFDGVDDCLATTYRNASLWSVHLAIMSTAIKSAFVFEALNEGFYNYIPSSGTEMRVSSGGIINSTLVVLNKAQVYTTRQGSGTAGVNPLTLGARSGSSSFNLQGRFYGFIARSVLASQAEVGLVESYIAKKSGVTL